MEALNPSKVITLGALFIKALKQLNISSVSSPFLCGCKCLYDMGQE